MPTGTGIRIIALLGVSACLAAHGQASNENQFQALLKQCLSAPAGLSRMTTSRIFCWALTCFAPARRTRLCRASNSPLASSLARKLPKTISAKPTRASANTLKQQRPTTRRCSAATIQRNPSRRGQVSPWRGSARSARAYAPLNQEWPRFAASTRPQQSLRP